MPFKNSHCDRQLVGTTVSDYIATSCYPWWVEQQILLLSKMSTFEPLEPVRIYAMWTKKFLPMWLFSHSVLSYSLQPHGLKQVRPPCPSPTHRACSDSCLSSWWCHPTISSSVTTFSSCLQSFPASGSFPMNQFFASGGQSIGVSASTSILPMNIPDWFPLGWTGWISLPSKRPSWVFSNTTVQKHQFFGAQLSLYSNSHIHSWLWRNHSFD